MLDEGDKNVRHAGIERVGNSLEIKFRDAETRGRARDVLAGQLADLLFTETAVFIGLLQLFLPLMILSLISALENMPKDAIPAARVLGANWLQVFWKVVLPLTREGLVVGGTLVFTGSLTAYITSAILGGSSAPATAGVSARSAPTKPSNGRTCTARSYQVGLTRAAFSA